MQASQAPGARVQVAGRMVYRLFAGGVAGAEIAQPVLLSRGEA